MHHLSRKLLAAAGIVLLATLAQAQTGDKQPQLTPEQQAEMEAYMKAGAPGAPHQIMASTAGNYDVKLKVWHEPGGPAAEDVGTAKRTMTLGGRVLVEDLSCTMMGMPFTGHGMFGYDNVTGKYWGTWNDNMSTGVMVSEGTCDAQGKNCTFTGSFHDPVKKTLVTLRMNSKWTSPTTETFEMFGPAPDGKEMKMMEIIYTKK